MGKNLQLYCLAILLILLSFCVSESKRITEKERESFSVFPTKTAFSGEGITLNPQDKTAVMAEYRMYVRAHEALNKEDPLPALNFLRVYRPHNDGLFAEIRNSLLNYFANREDWMPFKTEYDRIPEQEKSLGLKCYAAVYQSSLQRVKLSRHLVYSNENLPIGCNKLLNSAARAKVLSRSEVFRRARVLIANGYLRSSRELLNAADLSGSPGAAELNLLAAYITPEARKKIDQSGGMNSLSNRVSSANLAFAQGMAGLEAAKKHDMVNALSHFSKADPQALSNEAWQWYARAALFLGKWRMLDRIIKQMPPALQQDPAWLYWRGRAQAVLGQAAAAQELYRKSIAHGHHYYALLSAEELKQKINTYSIAAPTQSDIARIKHHPPLQKAIILFHQSVIHQDSQQRKAAQTLWQYALHNLSDEDLLAAAGLAAFIGFNEMVIESADQSEDKINFHLRYPVYEKDILSQFSHRYGIELVSILGMMRQDSEFIQGVDSNGDARWMQRSINRGRDRSRKPGMSYPVISKGALFHHLQIKIGYLADLYRQFKVEPLAIAAYNAGPFCAQQWHRLRAEAAMEGAVYVETIPWDRTRLYVKKVLENIYYYDRLLTPGPWRSLKERLG